MKPTIAVDITARDKTAAGRRSAEQGFAGTAKKASGFAKDSGFAKLEQQAKGFAGLAKRGFGLDAARKDVSAAADQVQRLAALTGTAITKVTGFAAASSNMEGVLGGIAKAGGLVGTALATVTALGAGAFIAGSKFADTGAGIGRTARTLGQTTDQLQAARAANEQYGVSVETTDGALESLGDTLHSARFGRNNEALGVMRQLGVQMKLTKDGGVDLDAMFYDLADAIAKIANPQTQKVVASMFGLAGALPAIRQGGAALRAKANAFLGSGAAYQPKDIAESSAFYSETKAFQQSQIGKISKDIGAASLGAARAEMTGFAKVFGDSARVVAAAPKAFSDLTASAQSLALNGFHAAETAAQQFAGTAVGIVRKLESFGWSRAQALGIAGNLSRESGFNPGAVGDNGLAVGVAQWHPARQAAFRKWAGHDLKSATLDEQLGFIHYELTQGSEKSAGDRLRGAMTPAEAGAIVSRFYERPAATEQEAQQRAQLAQGLSSQMTQQVQVEVSFRNAPSGMVARASGGKGVQVKARVARGMEGAG